ncbi:MAG: MOSC domain-containing protein [Ilumatobacteraceae bacterium]
MSLVQVQPDGLIVDAPGPGPERSFYDASRRVEVDRLHITGRGIEATLPGGDRVLDIHHLDHPGKAYGDDDLVSVGFSAHYDAMRDEFGEHMVDGTAGENIIIEYPGEVWPEDLADTLAMENQDTGELARFHSVGFATPCVEFSRFCAQRVDDDVSAGRLAEILRFLGRGRRGFLLLLNDAHGPVTVRPGDRVFL